MRSIDGGGAKSQRQPENAALTRNAEHKATLFSVGGGGGGGEELIADGVLLRPPPTTKARREVSASRPQKLEEGVVVVVERARQSVAHEREIDGEHVRRTHEHLPKLQFHL